MRLMRGGFQQVRPLLSARSPYPWRRNREKSGKHESRNSKNGRPLSLLLFQLSRLHFSSSGMNAGLKFLGNRSIGLVLGSSDQGSGSQPRWYDFRSSLSIAVTDAPVARSDVRRFAPDPPDSSSPPVPDAALLLPILRFHSPQLSALCRAGVGFPEEMSLLP